MNSKRIIQGSVCDHQTFWTFLLGAFRITREVRDLELEEFLFPLVPGPENEKRLSESPSVPEEVLFPPTLALRGMFPFFSFFFSSRMQRDPHTSTPTRVWRENKPPSHTSGGRAEGEMETPVWRRYPRPLLSPPSRRRRRKRGRSHICRLSCGVLSRKYLKSEIFCKVWSLEHKL